MSAATDISGLEAALAERARKLAEEHLANGRLERDRLLAETRQRLDSDREREVLAARTYADRAYLQRVQAAELRLRAELDHVRGELTDAALARLPALLTAQTEDAGSYLPLLLGYLHEAAAAIERDELVAQVNPQDLSRLQPDWARHAATVPGKHIALAAEPLTCIGGVLLISADNAIRYDNTFEGRMERLGDSLRGTLAEWLTPSSGDASHG